MQGYLSSGETDSRNRCWLQSLPHQGWISSLTHMTVFLHFICQSYHLAVSLAEYPWLYWPAHLDLYQIDAY